MSIDAVKRMRADHAEELSMLKRIISTIESGSGGPYPVPSGSLQDLKQFRDDRLQDYKKQAKALEQ